MNCVTIWSCVGGVVHSMEARRRPLSWDPRRDRADLSASTEHLTRLEVNIFYSKRQFPGLGWAVKHVALVRKRAT